MKNCYKDWSQSKLRVQSCNFIFTGIINWCTEASRRVKSGRPVKIWVCLQNNFKEDIHFFSSTNEISFNHDFNQSEHGLSITAYHAAAKQFQPIRLNLNIISANQITLKHNFSQSGYNDIKTPDKIYK